ncbi:shikimate kinase [Rubritalea squalenifaciens DSM 18772]|uniref:Shikimate kinase n=1 Tax=Rubritalea squalenifaciens DSM 18772 TaxID=1123071 RepID=A0A1M6EN56_9BACT|nr:shikimate kinase [Rubritalea squalenifaciens]SHI86873.1 shikimate kinase [Rubritalea squalenifaciens DSM 18772]
MTLEAGHLRITSYTAAMQSESSESVPARNIVLIGFMGSGKSTVGRELGKLLGYPIVDTDHKIEEQEGLTIPEIFSTKGEDYFRTTETKLIQSLCEEGISHHIIATGGGLPMREENRPLIRQLGYVVWLQADVDTILNRTSRNSNRPLLQTDNPRKTIEELLEKRNPVYEEVCHLRIRTSNLDIEETAHGILESARYFFAQS